LKGRKKERYLKQGNLMLQRGDGVRFFSEKLLEFGKRVVLGVEVL
jgi:hypothetical protein